MTTRDSGVVAALVKIADRIDGYCETCEGRGWYETADPDRFGEPGEPRQVQCLDSIHAAADDIRALASAPAAPGLECGYECPFTREAHENGMADHLFVPARLAATVAAPPAEPVAYWRTDPEWVALANDIRLVDGNHDLGAGELAARLTERGWTRAAPHAEDTAGDVSDVWGCHAHGGWHHHGGFQHLDRHPQHPAADHVHRAALADAEQSDAPSEGGTGE